MDLSQDVETLQDTMSTQVQKWLKGKGLDIPGLVGVPVRLGNLEKRVKEVNDDLRKAQGQLNDAEKTIKRMLSAFPLPPVQPADPNPALEPSHQYHR